MDKTLDVICLVTWIVSILYYDVYISKRHKAKKTMHPIFISCEIMVSLLALGITSILLLKSLYFHAIIMGCASINFFMAARQNILFNRINRIENILKKKLNLNDEELEDYLRNRADKNNSHNDTDQNEGDQCE